MIKEWTKKRLNRLNLPRKRTAKGRKKDNSFWHAKPQCAKNEQFIGRVFGHYVLGLINSQIKTDELIFMQKQIMQM